VKKTTYPSGSPERLGKRIFGWCFILGKNQGVADRDTLFNRAFRRFGQKIKQGHWRPCSFRLESYLGCFKVSSSPVEPSRWQRKESPGRKKIIPALMMSRILLSKKQSKIINLEALGQKENPWKGWVFQGLTEDWKENVMATFHTVLNFLHYYNVGCQALSHDRRFKAFSIVSVIPHNELKMDHLPISFS